MIFSHQLRAFICGIEPYFPEKILSNHDIEKIVETSDAWIVERTGIHERRLSAPHETPSYMGAIASQRLLERLQVPADSIDLIIVATTTPDYVFPATACLIQEK